MVVHRRPETSPTRHRNCSARNARDPTSPTSAMRQPSAVWQYIHLYNPRAVVPESIMPAFRLDVRGSRQCPARSQRRSRCRRPTHRTHGVVVPTREAQALLAYLLSLKQPALPASEAAAVMAHPPAAPATAEQSPPAAAGTEASAPASAAPQPAGGNTMRPRVRRSSPPIARPAIRRAGEGLPGAFPALKGDPAGQRRRSDQAHPRRAARTAGCHVGGVVYASSDAAVRQPRSAMPTSPTSSITSAAHGATTAQLVTAEQVAAERAKGK